MTRRRFLLLAAAAVSAVGAVSAVLVYRAGGIAEVVRRMEGFGRHVIDRLRSRYASLGIPDEVFTRYMADYEQRTGASGRFSIPDREFYTRFLLSTDFFTAGGPKTQYVAYYLPDGSPCFNPLAGPPPSDRELAGVRKLANRRDVQTEKNSRVSRQV